MKITPAFTVQRLAQLQPGNLFIFDWKAGSTAAIKVVDPQMNGDPLMLLLGPTFTDDASEPTLIAEQRLTVVSFGNDYTIRLPVSPNGWAMNETPSRSVCIATTGADVFFRLPLPRGECYVNIRSGEIAKGVPSGTLAYAKSWEILVGDDCNLQMLVGNRDPSTFGED